MVAALLRSAHLRTYVLAAILVVSLGVVGTTGRSLFAATGACTAPSTDYGTVTSTTTITGSGTYRIWTRMVEPSPAAAGNTYMLQVDSSNCYTIGGSTIPAYASGASTLFASGSSDWIAKDTTGAYIDVNLSAGSHTFKLIGNADGVVVDRLVLTQDTACVPTGTGDNCANPPDTTSPVVAITSPTNGATITGTTTITANATDDVAVQKVEFYVDGTLKGTDTTGSSNNYTYSLNPAGLSVGAHTLTAKAYDTSNNVTTSSSVSVTVADSTAPAVSLTSPTAGATLQGTITAAATATDNIGVTKVEFYVDGTLKGTDTTGTSNSFSVSIDTSGLSVGSHSFTAKAYDAANNSTTSSAVSATVAAPADTTGPTVTLTAPASGATLSGAATVSATASDTSGIAKVEFYVDNVLKNTDTAAPYTFSLDTTGLSNGSHTFKAVATDKAASPNQTTSTVVTATVSNVTYVAADINQDGVVDIRDFGLLKTAFGHTGTPTSLGRVDINQDGVVDIRDFGLLKSAFGH